MPQKRDILLQHILTEKKIFRFLPTPCRNPFYLRYLNRSGGYSYFMFYWKQTQEINTAGKVILKNITNLSQTNKTYDSFGKELVEKQIQKILTLTRG